LIDEVGQKYGQDWLAAEDEPTRWTLEVEERRQDFSVWIMESALQDMLVAAIEAYWVPPGRKRYSEVYGLCFGSIKKEETSKRGKGKFEEIQIELERVCIQHQAHASTSWVIPNEKSEAVHLRLASELFPYWEVVGDFHTHTYTTLSDILRVKGWLLSSSDERYNREWVEYLREKKLQPKVGVILAIAKAGKKSRSSVASPAAPNIIKGTMGGCHVYLGCYRILADGSYSSQGIQIRCPYIEGFRK
jgi:hypothetical protein